MKINSVKNLVNASIIGLIGISSPGFADTPTKNTQFTLKADTHKDMKNLFGKSKRVFKNKDGFVHCNGYVLKKNFVYNHDIYRIKDKIETLCASEKVSVLGMNKEHQFYFFKNKRKKKVLYSIATIGDTKTFGELENKLGKPVKTRDDRNKVMYTWNLKNGVGIDYVISFEKEVRIFVYDINKIKALSKIR